MELYSLNENKLGDRLENQNNLYNISLPNMKTFEFDESQLGIYVVPREHHMRLDLISQKLYDTNKFVEELMRLNNIKNPFSVKEGDIINYVKLDNLTSMYTSQSETELKPFNISLDEKVNGSIPKAKTTVSKPRNVEQLTERNNKVKIINNFRR